MSSRIVDESNTRHWRTEIPNTVIRGKKSEDLSYHSKWLYVYLKSVAGDKGSCWQSTKTISEGSGLSAGQIAKSKKELQRAGLIRIEKGMPQKGRSDTVCITDIWASNITEFYKKHDSPDESYRSPHESCDSPGEPKKEPYKEEPIKEVLVAGKAFDENVKIVDILKEVGLQEVKEKKAALTLHIWNDVNNLKPNNKTTLRAKFKTWYDPVRLMVDRDERTIKEIWHLWKRVQRDGFESTVVLSTSKLRDRFDDLSIKLTKNPNNNGKGRINHGFIDSLYE